MSQSISCMFWVSNTYSTKINVSDVSQVVCFAGAFFVGEIHPVMKAWDLSILDLRQENVLKSAGANGRATSKPGVHGEPNWLQFVSQGIWWIINEFYKKYA